MLAYIKQARRSNTCLNCIKDERFAEALAEARAADLQLAAWRANAAGAELPPFHGVPISIKEVFAVRGMLQTGGTFNRRETKAAIDATPVKRMREAGFIITCVSCIPELGMFYA